MAAFGFLFQSTFLALTGLYTAVFFFTVSLASTVWTINSEIYPLHLRGCGNSLAAIANWLANYLVTLNFLSLTGNRMGEFFIFLFFSTCLTYGIFLIYKNVPETKDKSFEAIVSELSEAHL